jgi:hypothetical protein
MAKILHNFYVEERLKKEVSEKLDRLCGDTTKGKFSSLIRVLLKQFNATPDEKVNPLLIEALNAEYVYNVKLNKRSRL